MRVSKQYFDKCAPFVSVVTDIWDDVLSNGTIRRTKAYYDRVGDEVGREVNYHHYHFGSIGPEYHITYGDR